jgi:hypothetical protein
MLDNTELIFALKEEIGNKEIFTGRKKEFDYLMRWIDGVRIEQKMSIAFLARRKKGKTALMQRFYNFLFTMNDPMIIPFYYRMPEWELSQLNIADDIYNSLLRQYAAFKTRDCLLIGKKQPYAKLKEIFINDEMICEDIEDMERYIENNKDTDAWKHAAYAGERISILKNERIIQILDEFQYLNKYVYFMEGTIKMNPGLCSTYHYVGASKISPVIVTGSYVTWLLQILRYMTGRYEKQIIRNLSANEAVELIYKYSTQLQKPVSEESALYMTTVTDGDPFYIYRFFHTDYESTDLCDLNCIDKIILHETRASHKETGAITDMWLEYLNDAVDKINDKHGKKIILYLAKHGNEEKTRQEILADLQLDMSESQLEKKLEAFIQADILSYGETRSDYKGLGDKFFDIVFRNMYQKEIDNLNIEKINSEIKSELDLLKKALKDTESSLASTRGALSFYKGLAAENQAIVQLTQAVMRGKSLKELLYHHIEDYELSEFYCEVGKRSFHLDQKQRIEIDIYLQSRKPEGCDFVIEVKNWESAVTEKEINAFIAIKKALKTQVKPNTGYIFYSYRPLPEGLADLLKADDIMIMYGPKKEM